MTRVSVCMATYNGSKFIEEQLNSILVQLTSEDEIIISDDSSTDNTTEIIKSISDNRIILFENNSFHNYIKNFEFALDKANGDYIFLSDQDDVWLPNKVDIFLEALNDANLVMSDCTYVSQELIVFNESYYKHINAKKGFVNNFIMNSYLGCCMAFDKKILNNSLPFPSNLNSHDHWIGLIGELSGKTKFLNDKLLLFRRHGLNFSSNTGDDTMVSRKSPFSMLEIVKSRIYILYFLLRRILKLF